MIHIYNSWADMPPVGEQMEMTGSRTSKACRGMRMLLQPGRRYEDAVKCFKPYNRVREPYPEGRTAAVNLIRETLSKGAKPKLFVYVNNRLEGNALETIDAVLTEAGVLPGD